MGSRFACQTRHPQAAHDTIQTQTSCGLSAIFVPFGAVRWRRGRGRSSVTVAWLCGALAVVCSSEISKISRWLSVWGMRGHKRVRRPGIEPGASRWQRDILPLNQRRFMNTYPHQNTQQPPTAYTPNHTRNHAHCDTNAYAPDIPNRPLAPVHPRSHA